MEKQSDATSVQPLWRSHVDLSMIRLVGEDAPAVVVVGGGEEDLRRLEMEPEVLLRCDGGFHRWSSSGLNLPGKATLHSSVVKARQPAVATGALC